MSAGLLGAKAPEALQLWLIAFSLWFYGAASPYYLLLLLGSIAWNYAFFRAIERGIGRVTERGFRECYGARRVWDGM